MYAIYGNIYHQYTPNVSIYTIHGSYGYVLGPLIGDFNRFFRISPGIPANMGTPQPFLWPRHWGILCRPS